jgi:hypothetical protein
MCRKHYKMICWVLVAVMGCSPMMAYAQPPASASNSASAANAKIDLGYITPKTAAAVVAYPNRVLATPGMEMLPLEVFTAAGKKFLGFDPLDVEQIMAIAEAPQTMPPQGLPRVAVVLRMAKPLGQEKILPELWQMTTESQLDGKTYRKGMGPIAVSIFRPDDRTVIVATDDLLRDMVTNRAKPQEGPMSQMLGGIESPSDAMAFLLIEPIRPLIAIPLAMAPAPPQLADVKKLPELLTSIDVKANITADMAMSITLKANDEAAAEQVEQILDKLIEAVKQQMLSESRRLATSSDPVEQAVAQYQNRMSDRMLQAIRPVRKGQTLTLATPTDANNPQLTRIATIGILVGLLLPAVQASREAARRAQSSNNLKQIALGLLNYESAHGRFPPAYTTDKNGKPLLSWRVQILPYMEQENLYKQFHLDEPWDSDHNKQLINLMPMFYRNPNSSVAQFGKTNYLTLRNKHGVFPGDKGISLSDIADGTSNTIMTVEAPDESAVVWTKPDDFVYDETNPLKGLTGVRPGGFLAGFADGSVRFISSSLDLAILKAMFMRDDGKPISLP